MVELFQIAEKFNTKFYNGRRIFLRVDRMVRAVTQNKKMEILAQSKKLFLTNLCHEMIGIFHKQANRVSNAL